MTNTGNKKKFWEFIKANFGTIITAVLIGLIIFSPGAKAWVMRQLIRTGFFNAHITNEKAAFPAVANFSLRLKDGNITDISSLRGKVVFINFWASWCPPCRAEFPGIAKLYERFKGDDRVVFLFIDEDNQLSTGERFLEQEKLELPLATRIDNIPPEIYNGTLPTTVILNKTGKVQYHHEGFAGYDSPEFIDQLNKLIKE